MVESYIRNNIAKDITILNGVNHGGQTNLQAATNALAPYAAELIGKYSVMETTKIRPPNWSPMPYWAPSPPA